MNTQKTDKNQKSNQNTATTAPHNIGFAVLCAALLACVLWMVKLQIDVKNLKDAQQQQNQVTEQQIANMKKIYVYDVQETLRGVNLEKLNKDFEKKINIVNDEVNLAQEKIWRRFFEI